MPMHEGKSPLHELRENFQLALCQFGPEMIEKVIKEMGIITNQVQQEKQNVSFDIATEYFLSSARYLGLSSESKKTYLSELQQFQQFIFSKFNNEVSLDQCADPKILLEYLHRYKNTNTHAKKSSFLRTYFQIALKKYSQLDFENLKKVLKIRWNHDYLPKAFSKKQLSEIINLSQGSGFRNFTIIWTFLGTGIRLSELCKLKIADISADQQILHVIPKGKENQKKQRFINTFSLDILMRYIQFTYSHLEKQLSTEEYKQLYVFSCDKGKSAINQRTVQIMFKKLVIDSNSIPKDQKYRFTVHSLRHCFAVYGLDSGIDIFTLSKLLGHESLNSTITYLRLFDEQLRNAIERHPFTKLDCFKK